jgi:muramoyltetrapeptide carboxypeptidase
VKAPERVEGLRYLAGDDAERAAALCAAFRDPGSCAVLCARGGYGCLRLLPQLDAAALPAPLLRTKRFVGFSDATVLHALLRARAPGLVTLHGPMPATPHFVDAPAEQQRELREALFGGAPK